MKQIATTVTRKVKVLTNPHPTFVSVVNHGAIQEPFTTLKHAQKPEGDSTMPIKPIAGTAQKATTKKTAVAVQKIVFDASVFKDEAAVNTYLTGNGYDGFVIEKKDEEFVAKGADTAETEFAGVRSVVMEPGVTGYVGKREVVEKVAKGADTVLKFDWWAAYSSKAENVSDVIEAGMVDGIPPGVQEVISASVTALSNVLGNEDGDKATKIASICTEMGGIIVAIDTMFSAALGSEAVEKHENVKKFIEAHKAGVTALTTITTKTEAPVVPETPVVAPVAAVVPPVAAKTDPVVQEPATPPAPVVAPPAPAATIDAEALASALGAAITKANAPILETLNTLTASVKVANETATAASEKATKAVNELNKIASTQITKKGSTDTGAENAPDQVAVKAAEERSERGRNVLKGVMGI
ncbi:MULTISPECIES: hypothetical protein [unclassified Bradyrhizobium]|uniref:hypothetical protein n=1 Tax=unclassified Bradyrhizobium TaxID=2631580 RepID=UPI003398AF8A